MPPLVQRPLFRKGSEELAEMQRRLVRIIGEHHDAGLEAQRLSARRKRLAGEIETLKESIREQEYFREEAS